MSRQTPQCSPAASRRSDGGAAPVKARHLYIHGGFTGTDAKFSFCFPPEEEYQGRFFQVTHQLLAGEEATPRHIAFALASGGYSVQTNMGGSDNPRTAEESASGQFDTTIRGYRVNAVAAKFSRVVAADVYGPHRTYGYLYGGSGGAYQTVTSAEMTAGRVGRVRSLRHGLAAIHPQLFHGARQRSPSSEGQLAVDHRCDRARRKRRPLRRAERRGARSAGGGHPDGVPAPGVVQLRPTGRRAARAGRQLCAGVGPDLSRRLLEQAGLPRHRPDVVRPCGAHPTRGDRCRCDFRPPEATQAVERPHG